MTEESEMEKSVRKYLEVKNITKAILFSLKYLLNSHERMPFLLSIQNLLIEKTDPKKK